ncbi:MAG TPA: hypothetical protein DIC56_04365 [Rhizobium sp.]|uniref:Uncharacterized protein n=2 Tax=Alphaproteobacteria TaxID=28211 RepID=A0A512HKI7_9HYPH|nr:MULTISPECIES: hypothetical protein [Alphaproteobacteria]GEO85966.1 hypothetical protein RNA01_28980 [Ciceribacter naphthalenivorans]GLR23473.1 hypothetical protein GCM10007920_32640 [Ciceribacter naphthalenivorans]GLT06329.1 hypothetical protein GCM10007926_32640 [Sphingomonas psychrolutea]HCL64076.1 hypothetical protein [Rhizobium sp.]
MSAHLISRAPIGSIIAWSDGAPRPPERHRKKLSAWKTNNGSGRLIRKEDERSVGSVILPANFTLHEADHGAGGVIAICVHRTFSLGSSLRFTIIERPAIGSVRIFNQMGEHAELVHLAADRQAAEEWLSRHGYPYARFEEVTADEIAADVVEGRVAA